MKPAPKLRHPNCQIRACQTCLDDHQALAKWLDEATGNSKVDHLGRIHKWMSDNGKTPETEWGWATPETFSPDNLAAYVAAFKKVQ